MRRVLALAIVFTTAFVSAQENYTVTRPDAGVITVVGISARMRSIEEAVSLALLDAARKAALFFGVRGRAAFVLNEGSGTLEHFEASVIEVTPVFEPESALALLDFDRERDVREKDGSVYVYARLSGVDSVPAYQAEIVDGVPQWVSTYNFEIPGFAVGIGVSRNKGSAQKTYQASYEDAVGALLMERETRSASSIIDTDRGRVSQNVALSEGSLESVLILETWRDSKTAAVWTLAAARRNL